jgi:DNA repair exonuclease SbcCD ATPase subunit
MLKEVQQLRKRLDASLVIRSEIIKGLMSMKREVENCKKDFEKYSQASKILMNIGKAYREISMGTLESLVTSSLQGVFDHDYGFKVNIEDKRGQVEINFLVNDGDLTLDPQYCTGGGLVDIISISLRLALWKLKQRLTDAIIVLDEPFRMVGETRIHNAASLIKELSTKLGIQFIIITHSEGLSCMADKTFKFIKEDGFTNVEVIER